MQEKVSASLNQMSELAAPGNTPSLDEVREKIEKRYTTALGSAELAQNSVQGRMLEVQSATTELAGHSRLAQIRASMKGEPVGQVTDGAEATPAPASASAAPTADIQRDIQQRVQAEQQNNQA
jgi:phage shock protein A